MNRPTLFEQVLAFHEKFDLPRPQFPQPLLAEGNYALRAETQFKIGAAEGFIKHERGEHDQFYGRVQMMLEELRELVEAFHQGNLANQADSLVDLVYFALGTAVMMGIPFDQCFAEVQRANMSKVRVANAAESRRLNKLDVRKPEGWQPPNIAGILAAHAPLDVVDISQ